MTVIGLARLDPSAHGLSAAGVLDALRLDDVDAAAAPFVAPRLPHGGGVRH